MSIVVRSTIKPYFASISIERFIRNNGRFYMEYRLFHLS